MKTERRRPAAGRGGFTLIEVLVALVILAVGLLGLEALGIGASRMVARSERQSHHVAAATEHLEAALADAREGVDLEPSRTVTLDGGDQLTIEAVTTALGGTGRERVDVTVTVVPVDRGFIGPDDSYEVVGSVLR